MMPLMSFNRHKQFYNQDCFFERKKTFQLRKKQKPKQTKDLFKLLIHRLSEMDDHQLNKINQLITLIFDEISKTEIETAISEQSPIQTENDKSLDEHITEAKNKLHAEKLEKNIEKFKQSKRD